MEMLKKARGVIPAQEYACRKNQLAATKTSNSRFCTQCASIYESESRTKIGISLHVNKFLKIPALPKCTVRDHLVDSFESESITEESYTDGMTILPRN